MTPLGERKRSARVECLARTDTRSGELRLDGYWPERNEQPLFRVHGGWVTFEDLRWLRDRLTDLLWDDGTLVAERRNQASP